jgi:hypothetical protein
MAMRDLSAALPSGEEDRQQAKELVSQRLALVSTAIWVVGILIFIIAVLPGGSFKPSSGMIVGTGLLALAALPWLAYGYLVERALRGGVRRVDAPGPSLSHRERE